MNYIPFEHFEAEFATAPLVEVHDGWLTVGGHRFFGRSLKSRRKVRAFLDDSSPESLEAVVISERGNVLALVSETDFMGLPILKPGMTYPVDLFPFVAL